MHERFSHVNAVQLFNVENDIHDCVQESMTVGSYFMKLKGLWNERDKLATLLACSCESTKKMAGYIETQKTMKFFMGLNESYGGVRSNVLLQDLLPTVNKKYSLVLRHEKHLEVTTGKSHNQPEAAVFAVKNSHREPEAEKGEMKFSKCNRTNHATKNCRAILNVSFAIGRRITSSTTGRKRHQNLNLGN